MLGTKHIATNKLSQRPCTKLDNINKASKVNINNFINTELNTFSIALVIVKEVKVNLLIAKYLEDS
jgi:predicted XRE-type DNA-binding protein